VDSKFIPASSAINNIQQASAERRSMQPSSVK